MVIQTGYLHSYKVCNGVIIALFLQDNQPCAVHEAGWPELWSHQVRAPQSHRGPLCAPGYSDALVLLSTLLNTDGGDKLPWLRSSQVNIINKPHPIQRVAHNLTL